MKVLVCGGAGYIGSNMVALLTNQGHTPVVYDNLSKGHKTALGQARLVEGDLADYDRLVKTLKEHQIEAVMHFAAFIEVGESVTKPLRYYQNNLCNTHTVLSAMDAVGVGKFVFSSTAATYGMPTEVPITENQVKRPINPYGETKWAVERMLHWQAQTGKLKYAALRYFNACGAGKNCTLGEDHRPESHLIPLIIQAAMGKREDIKIFGTDYDTADGTCIRDYIHIEDLCRAHLLALDRLGQDTELAFNLGNGNGYSVRQVIDTVRDVSGKDFKVTEMPRRPGDPAVLTADPAKARTELGWKTTYPDLRTIVETAWEFHNRMPNGYPD
ncbi:MAG: UDP-glucose 4-epimerase GalE [Planctomycetes bacterium]|nr:UDP-glucose 4-epimerase GalE [Planctomycetota bacterium]